MTDDPSSNSDHAQGLARRAVEEAAQALLLLGQAKPDLAQGLAQFLTVVANEAARTARFSKALSTVIAVPETEHVAGESIGTAGARTSRQQKRAGRRNSGVLDPYAVYSETGDSGLHARLAALDLEQLRDIIAEHGMDHDRLAMKWKDPERVIDRIVEKVASRASKGSAFRLPQERQD